MPDEPTSPTTTPATAEPATSTSSTTEPRPFNRQTGRPRILAPTGIRFTAPENTTHTSNPGTGTARGDADAPSSPGSSDAPPGTSSTETGSSPESSRETEPPKIPALADQIGAAIDTVTTLANRYLTDDLGQQLGLYLADQSDRDGISKSSANVLTRHGVLTGAGTETRDVLSLAVALGSYVSKQLARVWDMRRIRKAQQIAEQPQPEPAAQP